MLGQIVARKDRQRLVGLLSGGRLLRLEGCLLQGWERGRVWLDLHALDRPVGFLSLAELLHVGQVSLLL